MNPLFLAFQYLLALFVGTPLHTLFSEFYEADRNGLLTSYYPNVNKDIGAEDFDFIIVGAGSAGCVVANRLSSKNYRVLLLEAGGNPFPLTSIPALAMQLLNQPEIDWNYKSVPQKDSFKARINNSALLNRGKGLGGSGFLNFMVHMRGNPNDFDYWAEVTGDESWKYENVMPFFKRIEKYRGYFPNDEVHGTDGLLDIQAPSIVPMLDEWLHAGLEMGLKINDPNGFQNESIFPIESTLRNGTRASTQNSYLEPILERPNLNVQTYAHVEKVHLNDQNQAVGVSYVQHGKHFYVRAKKEVILSAGAISTPQILMLSGVGPKEHLQELGIPIKADLPVGKNLRDHFLTYVGPFNVDRGNSIMGDRDYDALSLQNYLRGGFSTFATMGVGAGAMLSSSIKNDPSYPDIYMTYSGTGNFEGSGLGLEACLGLKPGIAPKYFEADAGNDSFLLVVVLGTPKSFGEIKLLSTDPMDHPLIDPNYLSHPDDIKVIVEGMQKGTKMINKSKAFANIGTRYTQSFFPGCENFESNASDDYFECLARHLSGTMWHYSGTCRMGKSSDPNAVVDSQLRVNGITGLRVIDASVMPQVTTTNTNAPTIMIAEKGSEMILNFWEGQTVEV